MKASQAVLRAATEKVFESAESMIREEEDSLELLEENIRKLQASGSPKRLEMGVLQRQAEAAQHRLEGMRAQQTAMRALLDKSMPV